MPANGRRFVQKVDGYEATFVAGTQIYDRGVHTGAHSTQEVGDMICAELRSRAEARV